jgi:phosphoglycolate phosphatase
VFNAVIYDLDGTLVDSAPVVAAVLNKLRRKIGLPALPQKSFYRWISMGGLELVGNALNIPPNRSEAYLSAFRALYLDEPVPMNSLYPGVRDVLRLQKNSAIKLGI